MANERCPSCGASVRAGDPWCTLCWTDLRPPVEQPVAVVAEVAVPVGVAAPAQGGVDPLTAPLAVVTGEAPAVEAATWPCVECGARNVLDADTCATCSAPFGGRIARLDDPKEQRRKVMLYALGAVGAFLMILALMTFATTRTNGTEGGGSGTEQQIDWNSIPRE